MPWRHGWRVPPLPPRLACRRAALPLAPPPALPSHTGLGAPTPPHPTPACLQVFDDYLRKRASKLGAKLVNGLFMGLEAQGADGPITIRYNEYNEGAPAALGGGSWRHARPAARALGEARRRGIAQCTRSRPTRRPLPAPCPQATRWASPPPWRWTW